MWFLMALSSAVLLGFYDVFKKVSLRGNAVIAVLWANTLISTLIFFPLIIGSAVGWIEADSHFYVDEGALTLSQCPWIMLKAIIVLTSWVCGYFAIKHLPLTVAGPINATRPVMTLVGALLIFGEHLNPWQWAGVVIAILAFYLLSRTAGREGIDFVHDRWVILMVCAAVAGAASGLYDKYLLAPVEEGGRGLGAVTVQAWFNAYQAMMMAAAWWLWGRGQRFEWRWSIVGISLFLCGADLCYFYALSFPGALIAVVSMTRRSSVLVSFAFGALMLREQGVRRKAIDLALVFVSLLCLCFGAMK